MSLQLIPAAFPHDRRIASRFGVVQHHGLLKELEAIDFVNGTGGGVDTVKDDESLALGFQVGFRDDLNDVAIFRENLLQGLLQIIDLDSFFEVSDLGYDSDSVSLHATALGF